MWEFYGKICIFICFWEYFLQNFHKNFCNLLNNLLKFSWKILEDFLWHLYRICFLPFRGNYNKFTWKFCYQNSGRTFGKNISECLFKAGSNCELFRMFSEEVNAWKISDFLNKFLSSCQTPGQFFRDFQ